MSAGSPRIDFSTEVEWRESQKLLKVAFPLNIYAHKATYEIQFGHLERANHVNTSWEMGKFEVCAQKWADLSEAGYGVALLNDCKYGHDIQGNVMRLSLLRAPNSPDPLADRGRHQFTYALFPHLGDLREGRVVEQAYALNMPLIVREMSPANGSLPPSHSFFLVDRPGVVVEAVKVAEDGRAIIVRLYESEGGRGPLTVTAVLPVKKAWLASLLEVEEKPLPIKSGSVRLE
jgi:alpha-mannosidase